MRNELLIHAANVWTLIIDNTAFAVCIKVPASTISAIQMNR